jgi:DNA polymerase-3 subunit alpha
MTKKGSRMAFGQFEDLEGRIEVVFFPEAYAQCQELIRKGIAEAEPLLLVGEIEVGEESPKILAKTLTTLEDAHRDRVQQIVVQIVPEQATSEQLRALKKSFVEHRGKCPVRIEFHDARFRTRLDLPASVKLSPTPQMVESVSKIFGRNSIRLQ